MMASPENKVPRPATDSLQTAWVERLKTFGVELEVEAEHVLMEQGEPMHSFFVVLDGTLQVESEEHGSVRIVNTLEPGDFFGSVNSLSGRPSYVRGRMLTAGRVLSLKRADLQTILQSDAELGAFIMRVFILRNLDALEQSFGGILLLGSRNSVDTLRVHDLLTRNAVPFRYVDLDRDGDAQGFLEALSICEEDVPVLLCGSQRVLRNPANSQIASCLGWNIDVDLENLRDVIVVGGGPAGLSATVYAGSEGLNTLLLEAKAPGGQAGSSSRIENYLGFPNGISGLELATRALDQVRKFGADVLVTQSAQQLVCQMRPLSISSSEGLLRARTVVIATGAQYRKLALPNLEQFEGAGVYYAAGKYEAQLCKGEEIAIVGGGNSAGQAAIFLGESAGHVHILVRGDGLASSMSRYLIRRIEEAANITVHPHTEVVELGGEGHLATQVWRNKETNLQERVEAKHLFLMTGASPNTDWLKGCLVLDSAGFIRTGADLTADDLAWAKWPLERAPYLLESSIPGVFAAGDVRSGSVKRVASGVGEGALAISFVHQALKEIGA